MDGSIKIMDQALNVAAVMRSKESADNIREVLENFDAELDLHVGGLSDFASAFRSRKTQEILIIDLSFDSEDDIELLSQIVGARGAQVPVIATSAKADLASIRSLMRVGVTDFLPQPFSKSDLLAAIESAARVIRRGGAGGHSGHIISFLRSCGGVGATTLAVQSAMELVRRGQGQKSVALIDFDLQFGNMGLSLDIPLRGGLPLILEAPSRLDRSLLRASMTEHDTGISVLTAPESIVPLTVLNPESVNRILTLCRSEFDFVICDLPHAWTSWTAAVLRASDHAILVTELSVPALQRSRRQLDLLADQGLEEIPLSVVANRVNGGWGMKSQKKQAEQALGRAFDFMIRNDSKTPALARDRGVPLRKIKSGSVIIKDVKSMIEHVDKSFNTKKEATPGDSD